MSTALKPSTSPTAIAVKFISLAIAIVALVLLVFLIYTVATTTIPFDNDEANHAVDGWQVYWALVHLKPTQLYEAIVSQSFYPPVHSVFVALSYLLGKPGIAASRMPTVLVTAITVLGIARFVFRVARKDSETDRWLPLAGAILSVTLAIFSLTFIVNSVLCMLEMTGAMLGVVLMAIASRVDRGERWRSGWVALSAIAVMVIFLTKYSFGLFFGCGLIVALLGKDCPRALLSQPRALQFNQIPSLAKMPGRGQRPLTPTDGMVFSRTSPTAIFDRQTRRDLATVLGIYAVILGTWLLVTHRPTMWLFFTGHPSYAPFWSMENLLFYPNAWLSSYSSNTIVGLFTLILAIVGAVSNWDRLCVRVAAWSVLAAIGILTISTTNELRHMLAIVPGIWMLAGLGLTNVLRFLRRREGERVVVRAMVLLWALLVVSAIKPSLQLHGELLSAFEGLPAYTQMQDFALDNVDLDRPGLLVGWTSDQYRLLAIRWRAAVKCDRSLDELDLDYYPFDKRERALQRTHRKPQMASIDANFPREPLQAVLDTGYYAWAIETRKSDEPADASLALLQAYPSTTRVFEDWQVTVYPLFKQA